MQLYYSYMAPHMCKEVGVRYEKIDLGGSVGGYQIKLLIPNSHIHDPIQFSNDELVISHLSNSLKLKDSRTVLVKKDFYTLAHPPY